MRQLPTAKIASGTPLTLLTVVIPAQNEAPCIASTVEHLHLELALNSVPHEIVVVDDGSRFFQAIVEISREDPKFV